MPALVSQAIGLGFCANSPPGPTAPFVAGNRPWVDGHGWQNRGAREAWRSFHCGPGPVSQSEAGLQPSEPPLRSPGRRPPGGWATSVHRPSGQSSVEGCLCCPWPQPRSSMGACRAATMLPAHLEQQPRQQPDTWWDCASPSSLGLGQTAPGCGPRPGLSPGSPLPAPWC